MYKVDQISNNRTDISVVKGNTFRKQIKIKNDERLLYYPAVNDTVLFIVKKKYEDTNPLLVKKIPYDTLLLELSAKETSAMRLGSYVYTVQLQHHMGDVDNFLCGNFNVVTEGGIL